MKKTHKKLYILHGWAVDPQNESKWQAVRNALQSSGVESEFLPLPGLTVPLEGVAAWKLSDYVAWLKKQLPEEPVVLLGHSFGGQLSVRFSSLYPQRVRALILVDSSGIRDMSLPARLKRAVFYATAKVGKVLSFVPAAKQLLYRVAGEKDYYLAPPIMKKTMSQVIREDVRDELPHLQMPALVIWGSQDKVTPVRNLDFFKKIPNVRIKLVDDARHSPQFTHSDEVAKLVAEFMKEVQKELE
jgi:pimeloyl-ACP methyl ester carboxylesterase